MTVAVGDHAPDFTLKDQHGQDVTLSGFRGRMTGMLFFYPFAFSGVCASELRALRDDLPTYHNDDVALLAVSCDPMYALRVFADRDGLRYPLLSDFWPHGSVARAYGVFDEDRGCALRATFIIDTDGGVRWMVQNVMPGARNLLNSRSALISLLT